MSIATARGLRAAGRHEEARRLLISLIDGNPADAELQYETACVHDFLGMESEAVLYYVAALSGTLGDQSRRRAYTQLGSTYRTLGRYREAEDTLTSGLRLYPQAAEMKVFLAMTLHNLGKSKAAIETLLVVLTQTTADPDIRAYGRAIDFYAADIERAWPAGDA